jgi:hypothetical protein
LIKSGSYSVPASTLADLAADPDVAYISFDRPVQSTATGNSSLTFDYYDTTVNAPVGCQLGYTGTGVGVAVIDSGMMVGLPDFGNRVLLQSELCFWDSG